MAKGDEAVLSNPSTASSLCACRREVTEVNAVLERAPETVNASADGELALQGVKSRMLTS
jgi:glycine cleavage system H lipoate-binding protein